MADVLAALLGQRHLLVPQVVEKQLREKFPGQTFSWEAIGHWTKLVRDPVPAPVNCQAPHAQPPPAECRIGAGLG